MKNLNNLMLCEKEKNEVQQELICHIKEVYRLGKLLGYDNILEKTKWKEVMMGEELGDEVFSKSTGDVKGADARNKCSSEFREYKTEELKTESDLKRFLRSVFDGNSTFAGSMTYNGAGGTGDDLGKKSREIVNSYKDFGHYHGVFYRGDMIAITRVFSDYVTGDEGLMKRIIKEENGQKYKSTNGNSVSVHYENNGVREGEGEIVYLNKEFLL